MKVLTLPVLALGAALLAGCAPAPETYPVTGEECGPNDPVRDMSVPDCAPVVAN